MMPESRFLFLVFSRWNSDEGLWYSNIASGRGYFCFDTWGSLVSV